MSDLKPMEIQPTEIAGDIPWGMIKERKVLPERNWYAPQGKLDAVGQYEKEMKAKGQKSYPDEVLKLSNAREMQLERVELSNGLRYAVIRDAKTGDESFDDHEYHGLISCGCGAIHDLPAVTSAHIIRGTELGNGHTLEMMIAGKTTSRETPMSESFVKKEFETVDPSTGEQSKHSFHYQIDPHGKHFGGRYDYWGGREGTSIWMKTKYDEATKRFGQKISYDVCVADVTTNNQINFVFGEQGNLEEIQLAGKNFLGMEGAEKEFLALTAKSQRGVVVLRGEELKAQKARFVVRRLLGVDYGDSLMLDTKGTLNSFIQNIDQDDHKNPREVLSFVGATRAANWQPALLEG